MTATNGQWFKALINAFVEASDAFRVALSGSLPAGTNLIGNVGVASITPPTAFYAGEKDVAAAGTPEALATTQAVSWVKAKANSDNTGAVKVTTSATAATGFALAAGEETLIEVNDLAKVFIRVAEDGDGVSYHAS